MNESTQFASRGDVRALTFDVFGTVVDWRGSIARLGATFGAKYGVSTDWAAFADAWRARYQPSLETVRSGAREWTNLDALHRESLDAIAPEFGLSQLPSSALDDLNLVWHRLDPWPDAVAGLARLRSRFTITTLSNGNVALLVNMAKRVGLGWDCILGAEVVRAYKPLPAAYLGSVRLLGLEPEQCLMVAAHNADLVAAASCGLRTAFVVRPTEHGSDQTSDIVADTSVDVAVSDFHELADVLDCDE